MKGKKGIIPITITVGLVIALAVVLAVIFLGSSLLAWVLSQAVFMLVGGTLLVVAVIAMFRGIQMPLYVWIIGVILLALPFIFNGLKALTLAAVLP